MTNFEQQTAIQVASYIQENKLAPTAENIAAAFEAIHKFNMRVLDSIENKGFAYKELVKEIDRQH
jgi:hypothetical protein